MVPTLADTTRTEPRTPRATAPVRVGIVDDCELVRRGLAGMLEPHRHRIELVRSPRLRDEVGPAVDLVLFDPTMLPPRDCAEVEQLARRRGARAVVFTWDPGAPQVSATTDGSALPVLCKRWNAQQMVERIEAVADAEGDGAQRAPAQRRPEGPMGASPRRRPTGAPRTANGVALPGGLTEREAQIVDLISRGLSNEEIAQTCYLSINSIKTYIRTAYRKMGVSRRSQAVVWGLEHGLGGPSSPVAPAR